MYKENHNQEIEQYFDFSHLSPRLAEISEPFGRLADFLDNELPDGPEKSAGMRKLLEAKDCFVRVRVSEDKARSEAEGD